MDFTPQQEQKLIDYFDKLYDASVEVEVSVKMVALALMAQLDSNGAKEIDFTKEDIIYEMQRISKKMQFLRQESAELGTNPSYMFWEDKNKY